MRVLWVVWLVVGVATMAMGQGSGEAPWEAWEPPVVTLPEPNGFDTYLKAFAALERIQKEAGEQDVAAGAQPDEWGVPPYSELPAARVARYAPVLALVREALGQECQIPPPESVYEALPFFARFRSVARLLRLEAQVRLEGGDLAGAAASALDCMEMAQACGTHRSLIGYLVAGACEAIGLKALDPLIAELDVEGSRTVLDRLARVEALRVPMAEVLSGEERFSRICFKELMADPEDVEEFIGSEEELSPAARDQLVERLRTVSWPALDEFWAQVPAQAALPYRLRQDLPEPSDPYLLIVAPVFSGVWVREASFQANLRLRQAEVAAHWFRLEHGRLAQTVEELVPGYLPTAPEDPFGEGPLMVKPTRDGLLIYSVGPDGKDDEGMPVEGNAQKDSVGDLVVKLTAF